MRRQLTTIRNTIQIGFGVFLLYIGWLFVRFVNHYEMFTQGPHPVRPPAVEGFLPISALVSLKAWLGTGIADRVHPAGLVLLLTIVGISFLYKKGFCSWLCPVGTISEGLWRLGRKVFGYNLALPKFVDWPLMSLKYLILGFFVKVILIDMPGLAAAAFAEGPYNKIADVKMLKFFLNLSSTAAGILLALAILSVIVKNFWCRYLCPYGALLGIVSLFSPLKVTRDEKLCIDCKACNRACPANLNVACSQRVWSPECTSCLDCIAVCPKKGALEVRGPARAPKVRPEWFPALLVGTFLVTVILAQVLGYWQTSITPEEFAELIPMADQFSH